MILIRHHAKIKELIVSGHLTDYQVISKGITKRPVLIFYFDNHKTCTIRKSKFEDYWDILDKWEEKQG